MRYAPRLSMFHNELMMSDQPPAPRPSGPTDVFVTGIGVLTPVGHGRTGLAAGLRAGRSAVASITRFDAAPFSSRIAAEIHDFHAGDWMDARRARRTDRFSQFALAAARMALEDAALPSRGCGGETGIFIGSALGGVAYAEEQHQVFERQGLRAVSPTLALSVFGGAAAANVAIELGITGPVVANANSCAAGAIAIGEAYHALRAGRVTVALAGGVETPLAPLTFGAFDLIKAMSRCNDNPSRASRPFDARRDGFVMGEGAAVLVLETRAHAEARGAAVYGLVSGYGSSTDAHHMTAPLPSGRQAAQAITSALTCAQLHPDQVGYVNAHGSSTPLNDSTETLALKLALGEAAGAVPISGTKGLYGHALGASGAIEAAICLLALSEDYLPATTNLEQLDPACDLTYLRGAGQTVTVEHVLSTSFGFGGINAALVFSRMR